RASRFIGVEEMMGIFLFIVGSCSSNRTAQDRFQRSGDSISKCFHCVLASLGQIYPHWVQQPSADSPVPVEIRSEPKYFPYFQNCRGALDGTHIPASPPIEDHSNYRNRK